MAHIRAAQGEALFDILTGLHVLFSGHFLVFHTAGACLTGL